MPNRTLKQLTHQDGSEPRVRATRRPAGRPRKFREASRPITVTLPERALRLLASVDSDRARAIVKVVEAAFPPSATGRAAPVRVIEITRGTGIIVVGPSRSLRQIPWLRLVEVAPARFLLSMPSGTPVDSLEIALHDLRDAAAAGDEHEHAVLDRLYAIIRAARRGRVVSKAEILFVDTRDGELLAEQPAAPAAGRPAMRRGARRAQPPAAPG